ncbi:MAG: hypothetical protein K2Y37_17280 [Pirellulales bacterium]|nr:hypothetical protein [Pirellulales bacterium]
MDYNGGYFNEPTISPPTKDCPELGLTSLHGIHASHPTSELCSASDLALFDDNHPLQILPVGHTTTGGLIVLGFRDDERGTIFLKKAYGDFHYLADGIEDFFGLLEEPPPNE